ncbi:MAG: hypothetical protein GXO79_00065 [Chlorobi bacterium]|nr:hypothetical protein [Chlorobiota bacterium]
MNCYCLIKRNVRSKEEKHSIAKVEDLIYYFYGIKETKLSSKKALTFKTFPELKELNAIYKVYENITEGVDFIKYKTTKKKKIKTIQEQAVLISTSKIKNIPELIDILNDDYVGINIFAKNEE